MLVSRLNNKWLFLSMSDGDPGKKKAGKHKSNVNLLCSMLDFLKEEPDQGLIYCLVS